MNYEKELSDLKSTILNLQSTVMGLQADINIYEKYFTTIARRLDALEEDQATDEMCGDPMEKIKIEFKQNVTDIKQIDDIEPITGYF